MGMATGLGVILLLVSASISLIFNLDPTGAGFGSVFIPVLKYAPYILSGLALCLFIISTRIRLNIAALMMIFFILLMVSGSLYALIVTGEPPEETYLGRSLGGIVFLAFYYLCFNFRGLSLYLTLFFKIEVLGALFMAVILILFKTGFILTDLTQLYHVEIVLIVSAILLLPILFRNQLVRRLLAIILIVCGFVSGKSTGSLVSVLVIFYLLYIEYRLISNEPKLLKSSNKFLPKVLLVLFLLLVFLGLSLTTYVILDARFSLREEEVRMVTFLGRWLEFLDSPIYGSVFTESPLIHIATLHIPSHSDILDLLSFGGALTIFLCFIPVVHTLKRRLKYIKNLSPESYLIFIVITSILIMFANPVLSIPRMGFVFFSALGLLFGLQFRGSELVFFRKSIRIKRRIYATRT